MKVCFLSIEHEIIRKDDIKHDIFIRFPEYTRRSILWSCPNLSLLTIAGFFPSDWSMEYIDLNMDEIPNTNYDYIIMSLTTAQALKGYKVADYFREQGVKVILGGIHVSSCPDEALIHADAICIGEVEGIVHELIADMKDRKMREVYRGKKEPPLDNAKLPRYDLAKKYHYRTIAIQVTRGCPHQCEYCSSSTLYGYRRRQMEIITIEKILLSILDVWPNPFLFFTDDNLFIDDAFTNKLLQLLERYKIQWYAFSDVSIAKKKEIIKQMRRSGCKQLLIGFESLSNTTLSQINKSGWKNMMLDYYEPAIAAVQAEGIGIVGSFMFGLDGESKDVFDSMAQFIINNNIYATNLTIMTPFPGTRIYERLKRENRIFENRWDRYNGFELTYFPEWGSPENFMEEFINLNITVNTDGRINKVIRHFIDVYKTSITYDY